MNKVIKETLRLAKNGNLTLEEAEKIILEQTLKTGQVDAVVMPKTFMVKITDSGPNRWYKQLIGFTFTVRENMRPESYIVVGMVSDHDSECRIEKCDCETI